MKIPRTPPEFDTILASASKAGRLATLLKHLGDIELEPDKYLHWDELRFRPPPAGLSPEEWWLLLKLRRGSLYQRLPLESFDGHPFKWVAWHSIAEMLHAIDMGLGGNIQMPEQITNPELRDRYLIRSLMEEAITSSQLEGAVATREEAKKMIRTGQPPRNKSEQMILNNYLTMRHIRELKDKPLTEKLVLEIHRIITTDTLDDPTAAGRPRRADERIQVVDMEENILHDPPPAKQLAKRMRDMCDFANGKIPERFVHPVLRSIILHFWLAYDHPFVDGNGRVARALFYWSMLRRNYWLCEFISISQILRRAPAKYYRSFLFTETDDYDLTYFLVQQLEVIQRSISELHNFIKTEGDRLRKLRSRLQGLDALNHRQRTLVDHALRHRDAVYTIDSHQVSHNVVYETARTDLLNLEKRGLLTSRKAGRTYRFRPVPDIEERLADLD